MLKFDSDSAKAQTLAVHYSKKVNDDFVINFMSSNTEITTPDEAIKVAKAFWEMTDYAIDDNNNDTIVDGISDIEFWMHKLFNMIYGYLKKNGYEAQWDQATNEYESE